MGELSKKKGFIFDLDGVIYLGDTPVKGAREALAYLVESDRYVRFISNNASESRESNMRKLSKIGVRCGIDDFATSSQGAAVYIKNKYKKGKCFVIGGQGFSDEILKEGIEVVEGKDGEKADFVAVGIDSGFDYEKLTIALRAIKNGAKFIASNADVARPMKDGIAPGAGAIIAALEVASGVGPEVVIGKPNPMLFEISLKGMGLKKSEVATVGDRIDTDIVGGNRFGLYTILVLTGIAKKGDLKNLKGEMKPNLVLDSIADLIERL